MFVYTDDYQTMRRLPYRDAIQSTAAIWFSEDDRYENLDACVLNMTTPRNRGQARGDVLELLQRALAQTDLTREELSAIRYAFSIGGRENQYLEMYDRAYLDMLLAKLEAAFGAGK